MASEDVAEEIRGACSTWRPVVRMKNSNHVMAAKDLASTLGVSEMDLQHLAHERRLPFFVSGAGGFAIMSRDLGQWRSAVQQAGCCGE
jgi:hypothetical protein